MSRLLNEFVENKVSLASALERLLVICNKINNKELSKWCADEMSGYKKQDAVPPYRKFVGYHFTYSGLNGSFQVKNSTLPISCFPSDILEKIKVISLCESIREVEQKMSSTVPIYIDWSNLSGIASKKFGEGVSIMQIRQTVSASFYSSVYAAVRLRVINALTSLENSGIDIDTCDITLKDKKIDFIAENVPFYKTVVIDGESYTFRRKRTIKESLLNTLILIITNIIVGVIVGLIVYYCTKR